jgi:hypothetical protein
MPKQSANIALENLHWWFVQDSSERRRKDRQQKITYVAKRQKHTTGGIPRWSPTLVLVARFSAYVWQSGRDAQFSLTYGRMCLFNQPQHFSTLSHCGIHQVRSSFSEDCN